MIEEPTGEPSIMLCLSQEDRKLGSDFALSPDDLGAYACITLVMDGAMAQRILRENPGYREVWVAAGNEVEAVRLAAAIKGEAPWRTVYLVQREPTVSARGRAHETGLDGVLSLSELVWRCETFGASDAQLAGPERPSVAHSDAIPVCPARPQEVLPQAFAAVPSHMPVPAPPQVPGQVPLPALAQPSAPEALPGPTPVAAAECFAPVAAQTFAPAPPSPPAAAPLPMVPPAPVPPAIPFPSASSADPSLPSVAEPLPPLPSDAAFVPTPQVQPVPYSQGRPADCAGSLLSVVSGSGGSGKSTVAAVLARQASRRGLRTALVDGDLQFGDLASMAASSTCVPLDEIVERGLPPVGQLQGEPVLFAAPSRLEASELVVPQFGRILEQLLGQFDVVVVNTGGNWGDVHALLLEKSMATLMLIDQRSSSIKACRHALDLCLRCGIATNAFVLTLNRCSRQARFSGADVSEVLQGARVAELSDGGAEVEEMMGSGLVEALIHGGNPFAVSIDRLLGEVLPDALRAPQALVAPLGAPAVATASAVVAEGRRRGSANGASPKKRGRFRRRSAVRS